MVGRLKDDPTVRVVAQDKNSLAPEGKSIAFLLDGEHGFQWKGACDLSVDDVLSGGGRFQTKTTQMEEELERMLTEAMPAEAVLSRARELGVSERTLMIAKKNLGVISEKRGGQWYWHLPEQGCKDVNDLRALHPCILLLCGSLPQENGGPAGERTPPFWEGKQSTCPTLSVLAPPGKPAYSGRKPGPTASTQVPYHCFRQKAESKFTTLRLLSKRDPLRWALVW